jgi:hypothetical protein
VCVSAEIGHGHRIDEVAWWLHGACLVEELIADTTGTDRAA